MDAPFRIKAVLIVLIGLPVCVAIVTAFPVLYVVGRISGPPMSRGDVIAGLVFSAGAAAVIAISIRVWLRVRRFGPAGAEFGWIGMAVPVLLATGLGLGAWFGWSVSSQRGEYARSDRVRYCEKPSFWGVDEPTCLARAESCQQEAWRAPLSDRNDPDLARFVAELNRIREEIDAQQMRKPKSLGEFYDPGATRFYDRLLDDLRNIYGTGDTDRATLVCLFRARSK